jgi:fructose/tagatose bisphosphate aldolase
MRIITRREEVLEVLGRCRRATVAMFAPNGELPAEIEGLCIGAQQFADDHGLSDLPIGLGMTGNYADNPQFRKMSTTCRIAPDVSKIEGGDVREGCEIWLRHLACYENLLGRWPAVRVLPFVDHGMAVGEWNDLAILEDESVVDRMAMIMFDASKLEFDRNIAMTRDYVKRFGRRVVVEAACDRIYEEKEIRELGLSREDQLSKPEVVERFVRETGVDLIVPNLGTEHRLVARGPSARRYERELARAIRDRVGAISALHGSSSLGGQVGTTATDGIIKVNFYTAMAVGGAIKIYQHLRAHEALLLEQKNLWLSSATWFHDIRRRHVAEVCYEMLTTLGYDRLQAASPRPIENT